MYWDLLQEDEQKKVRVKQKTQIPLGQKKEVAGRLDEISTTPIYSRSNDKLFIVE